MNNETLRLAIGLLLKSGFVIVRIDEEEITVRPVPTRPVGMPHETGSLSH